MPPQHTSLLNHLNQKKPLKRLTNHVLLQKKSVKWQKDKSVHGQLLSPPVSSSFAPRSPPFLSAPKNWPPNNWATIDLFVIWSNSFCYALNLIILFFFMILTLATRIFLLFRSKASAISLSFLLNMAARHLSPLHFGVFVWNRSTPHVFNLLS